MEAVLLRTAPMTDTPSTLRGANCGRHPGRSVISRHRPSSSSSSANGDHLMASSRIEMSIVTTIMVKWNSWRLRRLCTTDAKQILLRSGFLRKMKSQCPSCATWYACFSTCQHPSMDWNRRLGAPIWFG
jgi:hypothetical protein